MIQQLANVIVNAQDTGYVAQEGDLQAAVEQFNPNLNADLVKKLDDQWFNTSPMEIGGLKRSEFIAVKLIEDLKNRE